MPQELRYWDRVGFLVTREQAEDVATRMNTATGKQLDEDMEEYVEATIDLNDVMVEIEVLFSNPPANETILSDTNQAIIEMMQFEKGKKQFIMDRKAEGMDITEAKQAYEFEKARMVRVALDLPDPVEEEEHKDLELCLVCPSCAYMYAQMQIADSCLFFPPDLF